MQCIIGVEFGLALLLINFLPFKSVLTILAAKIWNPHTSNTKSSVLVLFSIIVLFSICSDPKDFIVVSSLPHIFNLISNLSPLSSEKAGMTPILLHGQYLFKTHHHSLLPPKPSLVYHIHRSISVVVGMVKPDRHICILDTTTRPCISTLESGAILAIGRSGRETTP